MERLWYKMYRGSIYYGRRGAVIQAISAIDIALWDIAGKFYQQPIHILLGAAWRDKMRAYASTLFRGAPEAMRQATRIYLDQGFTAVKFGWGVFGRNPDHDVRLVEAAREEMGDQNDLMVDTGWFIERTPKQAISVVRSIEPFRPYFIEEILHPEDYDGYGRVAESVETPIACGEQEATEWGFRQLIDRGKVDILQPDLTRCGGFTTARKIVHMAELANRLVIPPFLVLGFVDGRLAALERLPTPGRICRVQHVAGTPQPLTRQGAAAYRRRLCNRAAGTGSGRRSERRDDRQISHRLIDDQRPCSGRSTVPGPYTPIQWFVNLRCSCGTTAGMWQPVQASA